MTTTSFLSYSVLVLFKRKQACPVRVPLMPTAWHCTMVCNWTPTGIGVSYLDLMFVRNYRIFLVWSIMFNTANYSLMWGELTSYIFSPILRSSFQEEYLTPTWAPFHLCLSSSPCSQNKYKKFTKSTIVAYVPLPYPYWVACSFVTNNMLSSLLRWIPSWQIFLSLFSFMFSLIKYYSRQCVAKSYWFVFVWPTRHAYQKQTFP